MRVAYQGEPGAYSEAAALAFDPGAEALACRSFEDVFRSVAEGAAARGILPMENSIGGSIHRNYDLLVEHELPIVGEVQLKVDHCLLALPGVRLEDVRVVHSHPQALAQCERWLQGLPNVELSAVYDTAGGAKLIHEQGLRDHAAVASIRAAQVFGLDVARARYPGLRYQHHAVLRHRPAGRSRREPTRRRLSSRCRTSRARSSAR